MDEQAKSEVQPPTPNGLKERPWLLDVKVESSITASDRTEEEASLSDSANMSSTSRKSGNRSASEGDQSDSAGTNDTPTDHFHDQLPRDTLGLAFSGGGIRSATFCLGILQALAKANWLSRVDYLSSVSGGGYAGTFLGRFFDVCRKPGGIGTANLNAVQQRVASELKDSNSQTIRWLRQHSNYLVPNGKGDAVKNLASFWRNLLTVHFVLAIFMFALLSTANAIGYSSFFENQLKIFGTIVVQLSPIATHIFANTDVCTSWAVMAELLLWLTVVPLAIAYWLASEDRYRDFVLPALIAAVLIAIALVVATMRPISLAIFAAAMIWIQIAWWMVNREEGHGNPSSRFRMALARNHLTKLLAFWAFLTAGAVALSLVDLVGQYAAFYYLNEGGSWGAVVGTGSGMAWALAVIPVLRAIAGFLVNANSDSRGPLAIMAKIPFLTTSVIVLVAGVVPLVILSFVSHFVFEFGANYANGLAATITTIIISIILGQPGLISFVNRSGPLTVYASRLARVFLGAVNPMRYRHSDGKNVDYVIEGDDTVFSNYAPHKAGGPLHLINVAVNETIDVASLRGNRDRQAENMAVGPAGINISTRYHSLWQNASTVKPLGDRTSPHPFLLKDGSSPHIEELNLRQWMGISGAAFSPGMGRTTSTARALLFTLTNLRLGYWWNSGAWSRKRFRLPIRKNLSDKVINLFHAIFAPQSLFVSELLGRFGGPWRRHWYLSDGGHFEMTGAYELLRRRVPYIIICDAGADKQHYGTVLARLIRLARIDFGAEFHEATDKEIKSAPKAIRKQLGSANDLLANAGSPHANAHAALFRVEFPGNSKNGNAWHGRYVSWVLYLRATTTGDESGDVQNYQRLHADFPNESTLDQFFNEPQWESYRKLGEHIGDKVFNEVCAT